MRCPFCNTSDTKVIDSRLINEGIEVKRRRECIQCHERFTTYEGAVLIMPRVVKRDGMREPFSKDKLRKGILKSLEKRPVSMEETDKAINRIVIQIRATGEKEISARKVGDIAMEVLKHLDEVAFIRFASVYRSFQDLDEFKEAIDLISSNESFLDP